MNFTVGPSVSLTMERMSPLAEMYTLSPFVWRESNQYRLLLRAVPHSENPAKKIARIYYGESANGIHFKIGKEPVIAPGPCDDDIDGCEDPTLAIVSDTYYVYYSGWNETAKRGQLLLASGPAPNRLTKSGIALAWTPQRENPKEATIVGCPDGTWRLFFEYAAGGASKIGLAAAPHVDGPWFVCDPSFDARADHWDSWHLSTGPVLALASDPDHRAMFYNGATRQAKWRIGWIVFDPYFRSVAAWCEEPLVAPPRDAPTGDTDIAFAASAVETEEVIGLYYSIADKDMLRAVVHVSTT